MSQTNKDSLVGDSNVGLDSDDFEWQRIINEFTQALDTVFGTSSQGLEKSTQVMGTMCEFLDKQISPSELCERLLELRGSKPVPEPAAAPNVAITGNEGEEERKDAINKQAGGKRKGDDGDIGVPPKRKR